MFPAPSVVPIPPVGNAHPMQPILLRYGWLFCVLVQLANIGIFRLRLLAAVRRDDVTRVDADRFVRVTLAGLVGPFLAWAAIGVASGQPNAFCPLLIAPTFSWFSAAAWAVLFVSLAATLLWLWTGDGPELIERVLPYLGARGEVSRRATARGFRLRLTAGIALGVVLFLLAVPHPGDASSIAEVCAPSSTTPSAR